MPHIVTACLDCGERKATRRRLCHTCYMRRYRAGEPMPARWELKHRFWNKVRIPSIEDDSCWTWTGAIHQTTGYGQIDHRLAHRVGYELQEGPIPPNKHICHTCDNRLCVRGTHLYVGTPKQNMKDAIDRNRIARGERQGSAKLTESDVREIRSRYGAGETQRSIAADFGISQLHVSRIVRRLSWTHV